MQAFRLSYLKLHFKNNFIISQTQSASYLFRLIKWAAATPLITENITIPAHVSFLKAEYKILLHMVPMSMF